MTRPTYHCRALVLRKTRLGETDLIVTLLDEDGQLIRAVAHGARKPKNPFASRVELFAHSDFLCARGRSLDTIVEAHLLDAHAKLRGSLEASFAAACAVDLAGRIAQPYLELPRLFGATAAGLELFEAQVDRFCDEGPGEDDLAAMVSVCAALLLKDLAYAGLAPSLCRCVICGRELTLNEQSSVWVSAYEGGIVCDGHSAATSRQRLTGSALLWADFFLHQPLRAVDEEHPPLRGARALLGLAQEFIAAHTGSPLRSIEALIKSPLFSDRVCQR